MPRVHFVDSDDDLEDRPQCFTRSRRRTRGEQKHTGLARQRGGESLLHRLVRKGMTGSALVSIHLSETSFSNADKAVVRELLETIAKNGLQVVREVLSDALAGLRACAEWFVETAPPRAIRAVYTALQDGPRERCAGCQLLVEILATKAALVAA